MCCNLFLLINFLGHAKLWLLSALIHRVVTKGRMRIKLRNREVNGYITSLMRAWIKPFWLDKVGSGIPVAEKIREGLECHFNKIFAKDVPLCLKENTCTSGMNL